MTTGVSFLQSAWTNVEKLIETSVENSFWVLCPTGYNYGVYSEGINAMVPWAAGERSGKCRVLHWISNFQSKIEPFVIVIKRQQIPS